LNEQENTGTSPFSEEYWKEEGGHKWVENLDATEASLEIFNDILLEHAGIREGDVILDVGCGGGANSIEMAKRTGRRGKVTGIDISGPILRIARERGRGLENIEFQEGDAARVIHNEGQYDLVFSRFGVMFFSEPVAAFRNLRKSMKTPGRMVFLCWRTMEENTWMNAPTQAIFSILSPVNQPPPVDAPGPFSLASRDRIEEILTTAGFEVAGVKAVDVKMNLGPLPETVEYFMNMGAGAAALANANHEQKTAVAGILTKVLQEFESSGIVKAPAAAWIVSATA